MTEHRSDGEEAWVEIAVAVDSEAVESVVELFSRYGHNGGVAIEEPFTQDGDGDNLAVDIYQPFTVRTYVLADRFSRELQEEIEQALWFFGTMRPIGPLTLSRHREEDWEQAWKQHFAPVQVTKNIRIRPPWHEPEAVDSGMVITLDPGMAFGTGTHPTTKLCLEALEGLPVSGQVVLDAGTGTGILAIAAALLGAKRVDAVDIDPVAVRQAKANVELNGLGQAIRVWEDGLAIIPRPEGYDLVVANIISRILIEIHSSLVAALNESGTLLLSGIIEEKELQVTSCFAGACLRMVNRRQMGDWVAQTWNRC